MRRPSSFPVFVQVAALAAAALVLSQAVTFGLVPLAVLVAVVGLPPVDIHGPLHYLGIMGPTCGMTRGVMWTVRGDLARAWQFNPVALLVIPTMVAVTGRAIYARVTGQWLNLHLRWRPWLWIIPAVLIILLSIRQQLSVEFLLANPAG